MSIWTERNWLYDNLIRTIAKQRFLLMKAHVPARDREILHNLLVAELHKSYRGRGYLLPTLLVKHFIIFLAFASAEGAANVSAYLQPFFLHWASACLLPHPCAIVGVSELLEQKYS